MREDDLEKMCKSSRQVAYSFSIDRSDRLSPEKDHQKCLAAICRRERNRCRSRQEERTGYGKSEFAESQ